MIQSDRTDEEPMPDYRLARRNMVDSQLRPLGVTDSGVLAAMGRVERADFVPAAAKAFAYFDRPLTIAPGRAMMPPASIGRLLSELAPRAGERALVIGSGRGYSAALLTAIGLEVVALESDPAMAAEASIATVTGDLDKGWKPGAPYDLILFDGALVDVPQAITTQLAPDGRIGAPLIDRGVSRLAVGRVSGGKLGFLPVTDADVPALPGLDRPHAFTF
jgi:protein-L-isoaspartate(D-aspartate) O-methyltransferase